MLVTKTHSSLRYKIKSVKWLGKLRTPKSNCFIYRKKMIKKNTRC